MNKIIISLILFSFLFSSSILSQKCYDSTPKKKLSKISGSPSRSHFNINNISTWIHNNGDQDIAPTGSSGFEYPKGEDKYAVFESGLIWGGKIEDEIYVGGSTYSQGLLPGRVLPNGEREVGIAGDQVRIFRVKTDWETSDLSSELNSGEGNYDEIRSQYQKDWSEWPADFGAPFNDIDNNGTYNPSIDIPGVTGAHQTIWYVANDLDTSTSRSLYGSDPMGVELQVTIWGYNIPGHLENVMFKKYKLINKSDKEFTDMYFAQWSDIDLGAANDDLLGIDTLLNVMYGYNGNDFDKANYIDGRDNTYHQEPIYGFTPPSVGFQLLQGPIINAPGKKAYSEGKIISNFKNLNFTSLYFYICADQLWNDPDLGEYETGTLQMYAHMQGFHRDYSPIEIPEQLGGGTTKFPLAGNPMTGEGWLHGLLHRPCDIRGVASSGPFNMAPGESQEIVIAQLAAQGNDRLNSVELIKYYSNILQNDYPNLVKDISQISLRNKIPSIRENEFSEYDIIELNIAQGDSYEELSEEGYAFQGFNIYQSLAETNFYTAAHKILTFDLKDDVANIFGQTYDPNTGYIINDIIFKGTNSGLPNIVKISKDYISDSKLIKGKEYFFGITGYFYNKTENKTIESSLKLIKVTFQDDLPGAAYMDKVDEFQTNANSDVSIDIEIVDPSMLTGDTYEITFGEQHYYLANDGEWKETNYSDSIGKSLRKPADQTPSTLIPLPSIYAPNSTLNLHFIIENNAPDYNYIDAISITFPEDITINSGNDIRSNHDAFPIIDGQTVTWGEPFALSADGPFSGGEELKININYVEPTFTVDYVIYDDGWSEAYAATDSQYFLAGAGTVDGYGSVKLTGEVAYQFKTVPYWRLTDKTTDEVKLEEIEIVGISRYRKNYGAESILDGFSIKLSGDIDPPINFTSIELNEGSSSTLTSNGSRENLDIQNYTIFGGVKSSYAVDNFGVGTYDVDQLEDDIELRFTGVYDEGTIIGGKTVYKVKEGGQIATCFRMVGGMALAEHPLNPSPGTPQPFLVRIPFEVWNVENPNNQFQVNLTFRDRVRDGSEDPFWTWNPNNRMYGIIVNSPYNPNQIIQVDFEQNQHNALATWVLVFYGTNYHLNDTVKVIYANPIQFSDVYTFTMPNAPTDKIFPNKYEIFQNYPNPFNPNTKIRYFIPEEGNVKITIYNILGQKVTEVINKTLKAGKYETEFNGSNFASGVYIYRIEVDSPDKANIYSQTKKMILLK